MQGISRPLNCHIGSDTTIEILIRKSRRLNANNFRWQYKFLDGEKTCIGSDGRTYIWKDDKCFDKTWVGVHGKESICMVTLKEDVDMTRVGSYYQNKCLNIQTMYEYAEAIISEVECMPYDSVLAHGIEKPFGVVSVIPYTVHEGSSHEQGSSVEYDQEKAIEFLKDKMKSDVTFTFDETVQTAISAFQHLCGKELKAEDIWVSTTWCVDSGAKHMRLPERKEYLDIISGASSGEGRPPKVYRIPPSIPAGTPNGRGWLVGGVTLTNNLDEVIKCIPYSRQRPLYRGGGCSSSDDDDDDDDDKNRTRLFPKKTAPSAGFGGVSFFTTGS